jgi:hypothetical protein
MKNKGKLIYGKDKFKMEFDKDNEIEYTKNHIIIKRDGVVEKIQKSFSENEQSQSNKRKQKFVAINQQIRK